MLAVYYAFLQTSGIALNSDQAFHFSFMTSATVIKTNLCDSQHDYLRIWDEYGLDWHPENISSLSSLLPPNLFKIGSLDPSNPTVLQTNFSHHLLLYSIEDHQSHPCGWLPLSILYLHSFSFQLQAIDFCFYDKLQISFPWPISSGPWLPFWFYLTVSRLHSHLPAPPACNALPSAGKLTPPFLTLPGSSHCSSQLKWHQVKGLP